MTRRLFALLFVTSSAWLLLPATAPRANVPALQPTYRSFGVGSGPTDMVMEDLDGDGRNDIVTGGWSIASTLWGRDGGLFEGELLPAGLQPRSVAVADLNEDGRLDVVAANFGTASLSVLLGDGTTFIMAGEIVGLTGAFDVRTADFDGDGHADLAVTNGSSFGAIEVILGNGDATFNPPVAYPAGNTPRDLEIADLNGDGAPDLVAGNAVTGVPALSVYLGDGDGAFTAAPQVLSASRVFQIVLADVDDDAIPDLVATHDFIHAISMRLGIGDGTFAEAVLTPAGQEPQEVTAGDVDEDGDDDVIYTNFNSSDARMLLSNGDGTFPPAIPLPVIQGYESLALDDVDGDAHLDLLAGGAGGVAILHGDGAGGFTLPNNTVTGDRPTSVALGLLNGDAYPDLVVAHTTAPDFTKRISVFPGNGTGGFGAPTAWTGSAAVEMACADVTGDGRVDIVSANSGSVRIEILPGTVGGFGTPITITTPGAPNSLALADLNMDSRPDIIMGSQHARVGVILAQPGGTFAPCVSYNTNNDGVAVAVGDLNGDGFPDVAATSRSSSEISIFPGNGTGTLGPKVDITGYPSGQDIEIGDFNGDGARDLAALALGQSLSIFLNQGDGTFLPRVEYGLGNFPLSLRLADMNLDGHLDVVATNANGNSISIRTGDGNGRFLWHYMFGIGPNPWSVAVGDINGDGRLDTVSGAQSGTGVAVLLNETEIATTGVPAPGAAINRLAAWPNPARGPVHLDLYLEEAGAARLSVFDAAGRRISSEAAAFPAGPNRWIWNRMDGSGSRVAPGVYFLEVETPAGRSSGRVVLVR